jgi:hypothetical protein
MKKIKTKCFNALRNKLFSTGLLLLACCCETSSLHAQFWTAKALGIVGNGITDQTTAINNALARADVQTIWFATDTFPNVAKFVVNGTIYGRGKTLKFSNGNRLIRTTSYSSTSGIIKNVVIDADNTSWIFDTSITVQPKAVANGFFSVKWYGAVGDGVTRDYLPIQKSINVCAKNNLIYSMSNPADTSFGMLQQLLIPSGTYRIDTPLIIRSKNNITPYVTIVISGETTMWGVGTSIRPTFNNTFAIGIQFGKGCKIKNMALQGKFNPPTIGTVNVPDGYTYYNLPFNSFNDTATILPKARDSVYSPYAGIVIDPFTNNGLIPSDGGYPGLAAEYSTSSADGSTAISVEDATIVGFVVGILSSPNSVTKNAELTKISRVRIANCKVGISGGQDQEKANVIDGLAAWGGIHTVFATGLYGKVGENSGNWVITNLNVAGGVVQLFHTIQGGWFPSYISNVYAEDFGSIGTIRGGEFSFTK